MDIDLVRALITLVSFIAFLAIVAWAWSGRRKRRFEEAANLPFADDEMQRATLEAERGGGGRDSDPPAPPSTTSGEPR